MDYACALQCSHGQLYVALSQCMNPRCVKVAFQREQDETKTLNVVSIEVVRGVLE
ncbi:hypothetical protein PAXRUDRAFT_167080 [Paxillus rubicundulus Ve08.2h10]|uniref:Uncharacterized protein n=1 Tax=Paxillus rubicundulus Ve08.2h10 TaxID=930991 RepID=A0A0D0DA51_9AGAM|nr:hypothetical protein PAXRUDRAFT_167080 [Paxillus rubicundulus Ve08.2h10]